MSHCAVNHPESSPVKFFVSLWDVIASSTDRVNYWKDRKERDGWTRTDAENSWRLYGETVGKRFMLKSNYLTVNERPVLMHGYAHSLPFYDLEFGLTPSNVLSLIRDGIRASTGKEAYLIATCTDDKIYPTLKSWGFNAFTEYLIYSDNWANTMTLYKQWWARGTSIAKTYGMDYWVPATVGFDSSAWYYHPSQFIPTPAQFTTHLKEARAFAKKNYAVTQGQVLTYAWNEFGEGGVIEPMANGQLHSGNEMLLAHKTACE
jgi:hypothetical protein